VFRAVAEAERSMERRVAVIGAALDLGSGRRGVDMGPSAIRYANLDAEVDLLGYVLHDHGNVAAALVESLDTEDPRARYWGAIKRTCEALAREVRAAVDHGEIPLVLGGDHSIAIGTLGGLAAEHGGPGGVIWFDAHTDINTPLTSPTGNVHGMPLAIALGLTDDPRFRSDAWPLPMIDERHTVLVGIRSVDHGERERLRRLGATVFTMYDIDRHGIHEVVERAIEIASGAAFMHVSFDMDVVDPDQAPGVGTPVRGGITYREAHLCMELLAKHDALRSLEVVEVNPILDERNSTGSLAVELVCSALGARII
jgi:arginase